MVKKRRRKLFSHSAWWKRNPFKGALIMGCTKEWFWGGTEGVREEEKERLLKQLHSLTGCVSECRSSPAFTSELVIVICLCVPQLHLFSSSVFSNILKSTLCFRVPRTDIAFPVFKATLELNGYPLWIKLKRI